MKKIFKSLSIYSCIMLSVAGTIYFSALHLGQQTLHVAKKQWNPAEAKDVGFSKNRLQRAAEYIDARLPSARGLIIIKNGKTVLEKYYWKGGPDETDFLHSLNRSVLDLLIGIAIQEELISGGNQSLGDFFPEYFRHVEKKADSILTIDDLLEVQAPLIWGDDTPEYWKLFYAKDRIAAAITVLASHKTHPHPAANFAADFLLSKIIHKVSSQTIFEFADSRLFTPMEISTYSEANNSLILRDEFVGFQLKTLDLAKLGHLVMNKGLWLEKQIVPKFWINKRTGQFTSPEKDRGVFQPELIDGVGCYVARGEGGQFILFAPERNLVIAVSSKSRFPLSQNSGYVDLFKLIVNASQESFENEQSSPSSADHDVRIFHPPNLVFSTRVPEDIQQFFNEFAKSIMTNDIKRVAYHYAKGYQQLDYRYIITEQVSPYAFWGKIFNGGSGELQSVQINKVRIEKNRAYMRGKLKYNYHNMNEGSVGWFPIENLIKLKGRWQWLGSPTYAAILDRDEYFDVEMTPDLFEFVTDCSGALFNSRNSRESECFSKDFLHNGMALHQLNERMAPFVSGGNSTLHLTRLEKRGSTHIVDGYFDKSLVGSLQIPPGMKIGKENGKWKWLGNGRK